MDDRKEMNPLIDVASDVDGIILQSGNETIKFQGRKCVLRLNAISFQIFSTGGKQDKMISRLNVDLVGMMYEAMSKRGNAAPTFRVKIFFYLSQRGCCGGELNRTKETLSLIFETEESVCINWSRALEAAARGLTPTIEIENGTRAILPLPARNFLVFVSPKSGQGKSEKYWKKIVEPMLKEANIIYQLVVTQRRNHALDYVRDLPNLAESYSFILMVGGDGIVFEVINGISQRSDGNGLELLQNITLLPLGGGTGNGLISTILHEKKLVKNTINAAFLAVKGVSQPLDLNRVITNDGAVQYSFLSCTWGLIADIDFHLEALRCLGEMRLYISAVYFLALKRSYRGRVSMKLVEDWQTYRGSETVAQKLPLNRLLDGEALDSDGWLHVDDDFVSVTIVQVSHLAASTHFCPGKKCNDGSFVVGLVSKSVSRWDLLGMLLSADTGGIMNSPKVRTFRCTAYELQPATEGNGSLMNIDGERIPYGRVQALMLPKGSKVLG